MSRLRIVLLVLTLVVVAGARVDDHSPRLTADRGVPRDVQVLAQRTWATFLGAFPARQSCIPDLKLLSAWTLDDRARYSPASADLLLRIPATAAQLETALVHEFAHHLEFQCPEHQGLRPGFLRAQGLAQETPWFEGGTWEAIPSELFAEATVEVVLGYRTIHRTLRISEEARHLISAWGHGESS